VWYGTSPSFYIVIADQLTELTYTAISLTQGTIYYFKVQAQNSEGYGDFSNEISALAAQPPDKPNAPATVWSNDYIYVFWAAPEDNGAEITSYTILIRGSDLVTYYTELTSCDGSQ